jgi:hypothetical protein
MVIGVNNDLGDVMREMRKGLAKASDGKLLKRNVSKRLRVIMNPLVQDQRARVLRLPSKGHSGQSLRQAVARQTRAATRWSGRDAGIQIIQRSRGMPRNFPMAGRMLNREEGWSPQTLGGEVVHQQVKPSGWFDEPVKGKRREIGREVRAALEDTADTIARSAHG